MATASGDISTLVFKRNIDLTMESYVLDSRMLRLLDEIEGTRNVADLSDRLGLEVADVKVTCARLFQQRLILPAQPVTPSPIEPNQDFSPQSPESESTGSIPDPIPDYVEEVEEDDQDFQDSLSVNLQFDDDDSLTRLDLSSVSGGPDDELGGAQVDDLAFPDDLPDDLQFDDDGFDLLSVSGGPDAEMNSVEVEAQAFPAGAPDAPREAEEGSRARLERESAPADPDPEDNRAEAQEVASIWEDTKGPFNKQNWDWPDHTPSVFDSGNGGKPAQDGGSALFSDSRSSKSVFDSGNGNRPGRDAGPTLFSDRGSFDTVSGSTSARNGSADIFTISTSESQKEDVPSGTFAGAPESNQASVDSGIQFAAALQPEKPTGEEVPRPRENAEAIGHFEEGVELLQRGAFEEALRQFEMALEMDPQNRLCRANIQRIQEKLTPDEVKNGGFIDAF